MKIWYAAHMNSSALCGIITYTIECHAYAGFHSAGGKRYAFPEFKKTRQYMKIVLGLPPSQSSMHIVRYVIVI